MPVYLSVPVSTHPAVQVYVCASRVFCAYVRALPMFLCLSLCVSMLVFARGYIGVLYV